MAFSRNLLPHLFNNRDWWDVWDYPNRIGDQHFARGMSFEDLLPHYHLYKFRTRQQQNQSQSGVSEVRNDPNVFQVMLDVSHFSPDEITVKTVDNDVIIHGKHEEKADQHGFVSREFTRRYVLPNEVEPETVTSKLSQDGILSVQAPKKVEEKIERNERIIPITMEEEKQTEEQE